jgi:sodium/proline symporter
MARSSAIDLMLVVFFVLLIAAAIWAGRRTHNAADFLVASRRLDGWLAAFGYIGGATNAWTLTLVAAAAFTWGLSAIWIGAALVFGAFLSVGYIAPRLRAIASSQGALTLTQIISADAGDRLQPFIARSAAFIALVFLLLQIAVVLRIAAELLSLDSGFDVTVSAAVSVAVVCACILSGGLRAASLCDALQTLAIGAVVTLLPIAGFVALGGSDTFLSGLAILGPNTSDWFGGKSGVVALAFAAGAFGLGFAIPGQPHAMVRFIAFRDDAALRILRWMSVLVTMFLLAGALACGWCARLLYDGLQFPEQAMYALATRLLPPSLGAMFVVAIFAAIVLSIASPMLAIASQFSVDLKRSSTAESTAWSRFAVVVVAILGMLAAIAIPARFLNDGLFTFTVLGAAFGPLLLVRLTGKRIRPGSVLGAMWAGFILSILFHLLPDSPGDFLERVLPFVAALGIALTGGERRRNPDRADRSQETVHDRIPI